jgi:hypothetical protein
MVQNGILLYIMAPKRTPQTQKDTIKWIAGILGTGVLVVGAAVYLGTSDQGQIDVSAAIANSNVKAREEGRETTPIPVNASDPSLPNGGLVGKGKSSTPPPPPPQEEVEGEATSTESNTSEIDGEGDDPEGTVESQGEENSEEVSGS